MLCPVRTPHVPGLFPILTLLGLSMTCLASCGDSPPDSSAPESASASDPLRTSSSASSSASPATSTPEPDASADILGEPGLFGPGGADATSLDVQVDGRECVLSTPLFGSCRASTGAGGAFVVTMESTPEAPTVYDVVVRCGTAPAEAVASAVGDFQPRSSDVGLEAYGEVLGVTLVGDVAEGALVYQPEGATCPVVWGLGEVDRNNLFTGGLDALNGEATPLRFTDAKGAVQCADADGRGGIRVSACP